MATLALIVLGGALVLPALWLVVWAVRDRRALRLWGHARTPSLWWVALGPLAYLGARLAALRHRRITSIVALIVCLVAHVLAALAMAGEFAVSSVE